MKNAPNANGPAVMDFTPPPMEQRPSMQPASDFAQKFKANIERQTKPTPEFQKPAPIPPPAPAPAAATPPAVVPPVTTTPADDVEEPQHVSEKAKSSWNRLRGKLTEAEAKLAEYQPKLTAAEQRVKEFEEKLSKMQGIDPAEFEATKKKAAEFEELAIKHNVENHPQFQAYFNGKTEAVFNDLKNVLGERTEEAKRILEMPDSTYKMDQLEALSVEIGTFKSNRLAIAASKLSEIATERTSEVTRSRENFKKSQEVERVKQTQQQQQMRANGEKVFTDTLARMTAKETGFPEFIVPDGADDATKAEVAKNIEYAKRLALGENAPEDVAKAIFYAVRGMKSDGLLRAAATQLEKYQARIKELEGSAPKPPRTETPEGRGGGEPAAPRGFAQHVTGLMKGTIPVDNSE